MFPQVYEKYREVIGVDRIVRVRGKVERADRTSKLIVHEVQELGEGGTFVKPPATLMVRAPLDVLGNGGGVRFKEILKRYPGKDAVVVELLNGGTPKRLKMGEEYLVDCGAAGLHAELKELLGDRAVWEA
jgi:DNA polymerase III alpha subunit